MSIPRILSILLVLLLLLSTAACNSMLSVAPECAETESPYADSPYRAMQAYVADVDSSYAIGQTTAGFKTEKEFRYPSSSPSYKDATVAQSRTVRRGKVDLNVTYYNSRDYRYLNRTYDLYWGENGSAYEFDRTTQQLSVLINENQTGYNRSESVFETSQELIATAKDYLGEFIREDLSDYTSDITEYQYYDTVRWVLYRDGVIVSTIYVSVRKSGELVSVFLREYRENAAEIIIPEGTDAQGRAAVEARVEENRAAREAENNPVTYKYYEIRTGILYYDEENRPYILYKVHFEYEYAAECADFIVYIE